MYEAIIFDLGGVIEKINPPAVAAAFRKLGMSNPESFFSLFKQSDVCSLFELGEISRDSFVTYLRSLCTPEVLISDIESAWCANQLGISKDTLATLELLKRKGIKIFLLSNTNPVHAQKIEENFLRAHRKTLQSVFDGVYYSFNIHCRKPDKKAYQYVLSHAGLCAEKCIYVDDLENNLFAPKELGLYCVYHRTNEEIGTIRIILELVNSSMLKEMPAPKISVGLVGFGKSGANIHAPLIAALPDLFELRAIVSKQPAEKILQHYPTVMVYPSIEELLDDPCVHLVIIATPNDLHYPQAKLALKCKKNVIVEKPFVVHSEDGEALIKLAEEQHVVLSVFHNRRWDDDFKTLQKILLEHQLGVVSAYTACWDFWRPTIDFFSWKEQSAAGSGRFYDLGAHLIDQVLCLFGFPDEIAEVDIRKVREGALADDFFKIVLLYRKTTKNPLQVTLECSFLASSIRPRFKVIGSAKTFVSEGFDSQESALRERLDYPGSFTLSVRKNGAAFFVQKTGEKPEYLSLECGSYIDYYRMMYEAIVFRKPPPVLPAEALMVIKVIEQSLGIMHMLKNEQKL